jgi:hypothetical protein
MKSMESHIAEGVKVELSTPTALIVQFRKFYWAAARMLFIGSAIFALTTVIGLFILAPLFSYWFFGNLRFWEYVHLGPRFLVYAYTRAYRSFKGEFRPSIALASPPMNKPDLSIVKVNPDWKNGDSCADCGKCCRQLNCLLQDPTNGQCRAYNTFYWRYFNCGAYPKSQKEIDRYQCPKWIMRS